MRVADLFHRLIPACFHSFQSSEGFRSTNIQIHIRGRSLLPHLRHVLHHQLCPGRDHRGLPEKVLQRGFPEGHSAV